MGLKPLTGRPEFKRKSMQPTKTAPKLDKRMKFSISPARCGTKRTRFGGKHPYLATLNSVGISKPVCWYE